MLKKTIKYLFTVAIIFSMSSIAYAQQKEQTPKPEPQYVDFTGLKGKVFEIKNRDSNELVPVLRPLLSGFKGSSIEASRELRTISVRDFPENIATIEDAIKRLDVARSARAADPDVEITIHVLIASNDEGGGNDYPASLKDVITQLKNTFNYKSYKLLTPIVHRTRLNTQQIVGSGNSIYKVAASDKPTLVNYEYRIFQISAESTSTGATSIYIRNFTFQLSGKGADENAVLGEARIDSNLSIRDGEKLVVGSASLRDRAVILVLSAKVIN